MDFSRQSRALFPSISSSNSEKTVLQCSRHVGEGAHAMQFVCSGAGGVIRHATAQNAAVFLSVGAGCPTSSE